MRLEKCSIGQRVICTKPFDNYGNLIGKTGTIVSIRKSTRLKIGVEFDEEFDGGHHCGGFAKLGHGRYGMASWLEPYEDPLPVITIDFDKTMNF